MSRMKDLFGDEPFEAYARHSDPDTSHDAAAALEGKKVSRLEAVALSATQSCGPRGMINDELVEITGIDWKTITPRMRPLERKGWVWRKTDMFTGKFQTRPGKSGHQQDIWFSFNEGGKR